MSFSQVAKIYKDFYFIFKLSYLVCSQIWLNLLVDNWGCWGGQKKNPVWSVERVFLGKKFVQKSPYFEEKKSQKSPYLDKEFLKVAKKKKNILAKFGSFLLWMIASSPTQQNWKINK